MFHCIFSLNVVPEALRLLTQGYSISTATPQACLWVLVSFSIELVKEILESVCDLRRPVAVPVESVAVHFLR